MPPARNLTTPGRLLLVTLAVLLLAGCATTGRPPGTSPGTGSPSPSPTAPPAATIRGSICYPGESIPAMTVYLEETTTGAVTDIDVAGGTDSYEVEVEPGTYLAFAYVDTGDGASLGGAFTAAVPCGLDVTCTDHTPTPVAVGPGQTVGNIDLCDWYDQDALPPRPAGGGTGS